MKFCAWFLLIGHCLTVLLMPFVFGQPRGVYSPSAWIGSIIGVAIVVPVAGRVLGWW